MSHIFTLKIHQSLFSSLWIIPWTAPPFSPPRHLPNNTLRIPAPVRRHVKDSREKCVKTTLLHFLPTHQRCNPFQLPPPCRLSLFFLIFFCSLKPKWKVSARCCVASASPLNCYDSDHSNVAKSDKTKGHKEVLEDSELCSTYFCYLIPSHFYCNLYPST